MNKSDLIEALAQRKNITQKDADLMVNLIFDGMAEALQKGERIEIRGFGSLIVKHYSSYTGRNPKTGEKVLVSEKKLPFFKVGKELKEKVDGRSDILTKSHQKSTEEASSTVGGIVSDGSVPPVREPRKDEEGRES